jgi:Sushi repeat (SCR repeat)
VETPTKLKILQRGETKTRTLEIDVQGKPLRGCTLFSEREQLMIHLPDKQRMFGIRITSEIDDTFERFQKAIFVLAGDEVKVPQIAYERKNLSDSMSLFVFTNLTEELSSLTVKLVGNHYFNLCQLELFALPDQCGHPEIPINGTVTWQSGSSNAIYSCNEGYFLEPDTETRTCEKGKWSGTEPICKLFNSKIF